MIYDNPKTPGEYAVNSLVKNKASLVGIVEAMKDTDFDANNVAPEIGQSINNLGIFIRNCAFALGYNPGISEVAAQEIKRTNGNKPLCIGGPRLKVTIQTELIFPSDKKRI